MAKTEFASVDEYIAAQPESARPVLQRVRAAIRKAVPKAEEGISYQIPAYKLNGKAVIYFAGWKKHYSLYPVTSAVLGAFGEEIERYVVSKGTMQFPWEDVPVKLISGIAKIRAKEVAEKREPKRSRSAGPQR